MRVIIVSMSCQKMCGGFPLDACGNDILRIPSPILYTRPKRCSRVRNSQYSVIANEAQRSVAISSMVRTLSKFGFLFKYEEIATSQKTLLRKSARSRICFVIKPHPSIRGKSVPLLGMLSFFPFEQRFSGVVSLAMRSIMIVYETSYLIVITRLTWDVGRELCSFGVLSEVC